MPFLFSLSSEGGMATSLILSYFLPMKKVNYFLIPVFALALTACGSDSKSSKAERASDEVSAAVDELNEALSDAETAFNTEVTEEVSESESESDNSRIDAFLDEYEDMIGEYDKYISKLKSGSIDMESLTNIASKAQSMQEKLDGVKSNMSAKQLKRMTKLATKFTTVAAKAASVDAGDIKSVGDVDLKSLGL